MPLELIAAAPPVPDSTVDEPTFDAQFEAFLAWQATELRPKINAALPVIDAGLTASEGAIAAAHYKGAWATLAGALAIPATVTHGANSDLYMLLESVADVTAQVPGVSNKWRSLEPKQTVELISTTNAAGVASVEWTNFDTLAASYAALRIVADGIVGSAATADLKGELRQNGAWITAGSNLYLACVDLSGSQGSAGLFAPSGLTNVAAQAISLDMDITGLGRTARPNVRFTSMGATHAGGSTATHAMFGWTVSAKAWTPTSGLQGLRIYASSGNLTGTFRLYGVRK